MSDIFKKKDITKVGTSIDTDLYLAAKKRCKFNGIKFREAIEYGLKQFMKLEFDAKKSNDEED